MVGLMIIAFALSRVPGLLPPGFSPVYAFAFCAGAFLKRSAAWLLPLGVVIATDVVLNFFVYDVSVINGYTLLNYAGLVVIIGLGRLFSARSSFLGLLGGGILGALLFYLITNTGSWIQDPLYPKTFAGWVQALTSGIPGFPPTWMFFRNTLLGGGLFTGLFVGAMKFSEAMEPEEEAETEEEAEEPEAASEESRA